MSTSERAGGTDESYTERLIRLQTAGWKRVVPVQLPYAWHLRALTKRRPTLEIGCGIGRNLRVLGPTSVGIDVDRESVRYVVEKLRLTAFTPDDFFRSAHSHAAFDCLLFSHVLEHLDPGGVEELVRSYLPYLKPNGLVIAVTPQELGFDSDPTHVHLFDFRAAVALASRLDLRIESQYSFPLPRLFGKVFRYNEFVTLLRVR